MKKFISIFLSAVLLTSLSFASYDLTPKDQVIISRISSSFIQEISENSEIRDSYIQFLQQAAKKMESRNQRLAIIVDMILDRVLQEYPEKNQFPEEENTFSGNGTQVVRDIYLQEGLHVFDSLHQGESNFMVDLLNSEGNYKGLVANEIGNSSSSKGIRIESSGEYILNITADGNRQIGINKDITNAPIQKGNIISGEGTRVIKHIFLEEGLYVFSVSHQGKSNFMVDLLDEKGKFEGLVANEIGNTQSSKAIKIDKSGNYFLNVNADGEWEIIIE